MSEHPVSVQIGRLIGNLLAGEGAVYLPSVGSLQVVRRGARRISKRRVQPPKHETRFSSEVYGRALPEVIAAEIGGDRARAQELYEMWLAQSRSGEVLTIFGVGTLQNGLFRMEAEFDRRLNPQGAAPVQLKRLYRFDWALACGLLAIVAAVGCGGYYFLQFYADDAPQPERELLAETEQTEPLSDPMNGPDAAPDAAPSAPEQHELPESQPGSPSQLRLHPQPQPQSEPRLQRQSQPQPEPVVEPAPAPAPAPAVEVHNDNGEPANLASGRRYVVFGVYSTLDNARQACEKAAEQVAGLRCDIYRFGEKFLISPFSSEEEEACQTYARGQREAFPDVWVYTAR